MKLFARLLPTALLGCAVALFLPGCAAEPAPANEASAELDRLVDEYIELSSRSSGPWSREALETGAPDLTPGSFEARIDSRRQLLERVRRIDPEPLTLPERTDRTTMIALLDATVYDAERRRAWETQPSLYVPARQIGSLFGPSGDLESEAGVSRARALLAAVPAALEQARSSLTRPTERATREAIFQTRGTVESLRVGFETLGDEELRALAKAALAALETHQVFLESDLLPRSDGSWAIGKEHYDYLLQNRWLMDLDADEILRRGREAFERTVEEAQEVAERIAPGKHWIEVYEELKDDHPPAARLKEAYQEQMDAARRFVLEHGVVTLPEGEEVITIDTPPAMRRSSPYGTFRTARPDEPEMQGRLVLTPIDTSLPPEKQKERLRAHHRAWLPIIAVHEAYPGHHVQALKVYENPRRLRHYVRESIFSEGWGLYTEKLMYELGFLQGDDVKLTQLRNRLWRAARVILDSSLHTNKMTFEEAVDFMVDNVRFDRAAAELEVGMYTVRPTYVLGYLIGMIEIEEMRDAWIARYGEPSEPRELYDRLLRIGSLPPSLVRAELLAEAP